MRKRLFLIPCLLIFIFFVGCNGMTISTARYNEIKEYVETHANKIVVSGDVEFFTYKTTGLSIGGVYYGYYYSESNDVLIPDYYSGDNIGNAETKDDGTYFGKPNNGTDWCYVKQIMDHWFYYELHWA